MATSAAVERQELAKKALNDLNQSYDALNKQVEEYEKNVAKSGDAQAAAGRLAEQDLNARAVGYQNLQSVEQIFSAFDRDRENAAKVAAQLQIQLVNEDTKTHEENFQKVKAMTDAYAESQKELLRIMKDQIQVNDQWAKKVEEDFTKINEQAKETSRSVQEGFNKLFSPIDTMIKGVLTGTQTMGSSMKRFAQNMVIDITEAVAKAMIQFAAFNALKFGGSLIGGNAGSAISGLGTSLGPGAIGTGISFFSRLFGAGGGSQFPNSASDPGAQSIDQLSTSLVGNTAATLSNTTGLLGLAAKTISGALGAVSSIMSIGKLFGFESGGIS